LAYPTLKRWLDESAPVDSPRELSLVEVAEPASGQEPHRQRLRIELGNGVAMELAEPMSATETMEWVRELRSC